MIDWTAIMSVFVGGIPGYLLAIAGIGVTLWQLSLNTKITKATEQVVIAAETKLEAIHDDLSGRLSLLLSKVASEERAAGVLQGGEDERKRAMVKNGETASKHLPPSAFMVVVETDDDKVVWSNKVASDLFGHSPDVLLGMGCVHLMPELVPIVVQSSGSRQVAGKTADGQTLTLDVSLYQSYHCVVVTGSIHEMGTL